MVLRCFVEVVWLGVEASKVLFFGLCLGAAKVLGERVPVQESGFKGSGVRASFRVGGSGFHIYFRD